MFIAKNSLEVKAVACFLERLPHMQQEHQIQEIQTLQGLTFPEAWHIATLTEAVMPGVSYVSTAVGQQQSLMVCTAPQADSIPQLPFLMFLPP